MPIAFDLQYNKVNCVMDCVEIERHNSKKVIHPVLTKYKKANTYKFLIACIPHGLVRFVCAGYGGRISELSWTQ